IRLWRGRVEVYLRAGENEKGYIRRAAHDADTNMIIGIKELEWERCEDDEMRKESVWMVDDEGEKV
ncbi:hypothetical protein PV325_014132, partial [Microctonus aethiopoides]